VHNLLASRVIPNDFLGWHKNLLKNHIFNHKTLNKMISRLPKLFVTVLFCSLLIATGCKSKKKALEAQKAEKARMEQEAALKKQRDEDEAKRKAEAEERARAEAADAEAKRKAAASTPAARLDQYFNAIAASGNASSANGSISEALTLFSSGQTPVLIVISEENGSKDYDKPTTIQDYLNYLKDQKKNLNSITDLKFDGAGKITEVELTRKK
jgi:hypothetical protein